MTPAGRPTGRVLPGLLLLLAVLLYALFVEPAWLRVRSLRIPNPAFARVLGGRRAVFLSDIHIGAASPAVIRKTLARIREIRPDLILLGGDYVDWEGGGAAYREALAFLAGLEAPLGVYAVLGDADEVDPRRSCLFCHEEGSAKPTRAHGVRILRNRAETIRLPGGPLRIVGLKAPTRTGGARIPAGLLEDDGPAIVLSPTSMPYNGLPADRDLLVLAGDTHGGQVRLPAAFWRLSGRKPDPEHMYGLFRNGRKTLYVTSGVGTSRPHLRLGRRPEIVLLEFAAEEDDRR